MTLVVRNGHPLLADPQAHEHIENYPLVLPLAGTTIRKFADSLFVQAQHQPTASASGNPVVDLESALCAVQSSRDLVSRLFDAVSAGPESKVTWLSWSWVFANPVVLWGCAAILR